MPGVRSDTGFRAIKRSVTKVFPLRNETVTSRQARRNSVTVVFRLNRAPADGTIPPSRFHRSGWSFREMPSVLGALEKVETAVDVVVLDAQGLAHPRRMGLASHIGLFLDVPTVGCAKSVLVGKFEEPGIEKGSATDLVHCGEVVGRVVRTREKVSPVYVSVGNGIDLDSSVELVLACSTRYRLPEPTRQAHNAANRLRRGEEPGGSLF